MTALQATRSIRFPTTTGPFLVAILHRDHWHETELDIPFERVCATAEEAHRRSGLQVQVREFDGTVVYEAAGNDDDWR
jgi:hypothetical protein